MIKLFSKHIQAVFYAVLIGSSSLYAISSGTCTDAPIQCFTDADCLDFGTCDVGGAVNTPPTASNVTITGTLKESETISVTYDFSDPDPGDTELGTTFKWFRADANDCSNSELLTTEPFGTTTPEYTLQAADVGKYMQVWVYPNDGKGAGNGVPSNCDGPVSTNNPPVITSVPVTSATVDLLYSYDINASDTDGDTINFRLVEGPAWLSLEGTVKNSAKLFGTPPKDGNYTISLVANDGKVDSTPQNFKITVTTANTPPQIISSPCVSVTVGEPYFCPIEATDKDGDDIDFNVTGPNWLSYNDVGYGQIELSGDPTVLGDYDVTVMASDNEGNDTLTFTITVSGSDLPVLPDDLLEIISKPETKITLGEYIRYTYDDATKTVYDIDRSVTYIDQNVSSMKWTWDEAVQYCDNLFYASIDDWRLPHVEELLDIRNNRTEAGFIYLDNRGENSYYWSDEYNVSIAAIVILDPAFSFLEGGFPVMKSNKHIATCVRDGRLDSVTPNGSIYYEYVITTKNATGKVTYSLVEPSEGASWLKFDENTGTLSGIATHKDVGDVVVTILVKDDLTEVTQSFTISVTEPEPEPELEPAECSCNIATYSSKPQNIDMLFILIVITTLLYPFRKKFIKED